MLFDYGNCCPWWHTKSYCFHRRFCQPGSCPSDLDAVTTNGNTDGPLTLGHQSYATKLLVSCTLKRCPDFPGTLMKFSFDFTPQRFDVFK